MSGFKYGGAAVNQIFASRLNRCFERSSRLRARSFSASPGEYVSPSAPEMNSSTIAVVKSTAPILATHGYAITQAMYKKMLSENSTMREMFNPTHHVELPGQLRASQPEALACSVYQYAAHIDDLSSLAETIDRIAQKHTSIYVLPEHYPVVKEYLFWAMNHVLGSKITPAVTNAWSEAYDFLAHVLIERERRLRTDKAQQDGGWEGFREFEVVKKTVESSEITSFLMKPRDGRPIMEYHPGAYVAVRVNTPVSGRTVRNYTLSAAPGHDSYRITVKRHPPLMPFTPPGAVSNFLHDAVKEGDVLELGVPCGDFVLRMDEVGDKPVVLISGGVGITPILSMFEFLCERGREFPNTVIMVNSVRNPEVEAMHDELLLYAKNATERDGNDSQDNASTGRVSREIRVATLYDEEEIATAIGGAVHVHHPPYDDDAITLMRRLGHVVSFRDAHFYFCGPPLFMEKVHAGLRDVWHVPPEQLHFEHFGPESVKL